MLLVHETVHENITPSRRCLSCFRQPNTSAIYAVFKIFNRSHSIQLRD